MVILLATGPSLGGFAGRQATFAYFLAGALFLLTIGTRFPLGAFKAVSFAMHGAIELVFAALLLVLPWIADFSRGVLSRNFYVAIAILMMGTWFLTDFRGVRTRVAQ